MNPDVTVVIPQYNRCELTLRCCRSLRETHGDEASLLIVDDGSAPGELALHRRSLSSLGLLIELPHRGVTAAWNAAALQASTPWLVFLNNDTTSLGPWGERLVEPLRRSTAVLSGVAWRYERDLPGPVAADPRTFRLLAGWCFAISRERLLDLGGFDSSLTLYFSDTDLQLRLIAQDSGDAPLLCVEGLPVVHRGHATAHGLRDQKRLWNRDRQTFLAKWRGGFPAERPSTSPPKLGCGARHASAANL